MAKASSKQASGDDEYDIVAKDNDMFAGCPSKKHEASGMRVHKRSSFNSFLAETLLEKNLGKRRSVRCNRVLRRRGILVHGGAPLLPCRQHHEDGRHRCSLRVFFGSEGCFFFCSVLLDRKFAYECGWRREINIATTTTPPSDH